MYTHNNNLPPGNTPFAVYYIILYFILHIIIIIIIIIMFLKGWPVSFSLILKMKLVPPSLPRSSYVPSSFWFILVYILLLLFLNAVRLTHGGRSTVHIYTKQYIEQYN